jgi:hypothetical protein
MKERAWTRMANGVEVPSDRDRTCVRILAAGDTHGDNGATRDQGIDLGVVATGGRLFSLITCPCASRPAAIT